MPSVCTWARKRAPKYSCASVGIILTVDYANNVPVNLNECKSCFLFPVIFKHDSGQLESLGSFGHYAYSLEIFHLLIE